MKKEGLLYGAVILLLSNFLVKCLGFFYRVFLVRVLGTEGIGLVEMVLPFFTFIIVITTWGIPLAMSKLLAEETAKGNWGNIHSIFRFTMLLLIVSGVTVTFLIINFAPLILTHFVLDSRIYFCFVTMIPVIFIIAVCSVFRAYFQGTKQVSAIGFAQGIEQAIRVVVGITLAVKLKKYGLEIAVTAVAAASVAGELAGLIFMIYKYQRSKKRVPAAPWAYKPSYRSLMYGLFSFGTPVTLTRILSSLLMALQASLIPRGLMMAGNSMRAATEIYGRFSGVALTLLHLPSIITMSMAVSVMPAVAELTGSGNRKLLNHRITEALWITSTFAIPGMVVLFYYSGELCRLIFHAPQAGEPLKILAMGGLFCYLQQTLTSILQGMGRVKMLFLNNLCSGLCLIGGIILFTPVKGLEINGAAASLSLSYFVGCTLNLFYLIKIARLDLPFTKILIKPISAGFIALFALNLADLLLRPVMSSLSITMVTAVCISSAIYFLFLLFVGGLPTHTIKRLPYFNKLFPKSN